VSAGGNSEIEHRNAMEDDPQRRRPDITRAKQYIGWYPRVSLDQLQIETNDSGLLDVFINKNFKCQNC